MTASIGITVIAFCAWAYALFLFCAWGMIAYWCLRKKLRVER